ncbi:MAG: hypothetical protein ACR2JY_11975, partial [Chloroflexota bacterium]
MKGSRHVTSPCCPTAAGARAASAGLPTPALASVWSPRRGVAHYRAGLPATTVPAGAFRLGTGSAHELTDRRSRTSRTSVSAQGLFQTTISVGSLNYRDAHGAWQPIDDTLVPDPAPGSAFTNQANRYQLHLPAQLGAGPVQLTVGGQTVSFAPLAVTGNTPAAAAGATASYANVWPGVSVRYAALPDGVQEALTLASAAPHTFAFALTLSPGLTAAAQPDGRVTITDHQGAVVFTLPAPSMQDSSGRPAGRSRAVHLTLSPDGTTLTLAADPAWLADPARVYPVRIDPSVTLAPPPRTATWWGAATPPAASAACPSSRRAGTARRPCALCSSSTW